jgi:hypothetical protein
LTTVTFESPSRLQSFGGFAFGGCWALQSITIPATVEDIGNYSFEDCVALSEFRFELPRRFRHLTLAQDCDWLTQTVAIPDAVESLHCDIGFKREGYLTLEFGRESRLVEVQLWQDRRKSPRRVFARFQETTVKRLRDSREFLLG